MQWLFEEKKRYRNGAFWEDSYHATAVSSDRHLIQCIAYIDLNMVRAGVVSHPLEWTFSGYSEIQEPRRKCALIAYERLRELTGFGTYEQLRAAHSHWADEYLEDGSGVRDSKWTESIAVGSKEFVGRTKEVLGIRDRTRKVLETGEAFQLRELGVRYPVISGVKNDNIAAENSYSWNVNRNIPTT